MQNSYFPIIYYSQASPEVQAIYDETMKLFNIGFVFNYFKAMGSNYPLLKGTWEKIKAVYFDCSLTPMVKEEIIYRISSKKQCPYCSYIHAKAIEDIKKQIELLKGHSVEPAVNPVEEQAIELVVDMALNSPIDSQGYCTQLALLGYTTVEIQELLAIGELTLMFNNHARMFGIQVDEEMLG